MSIYWRGDFRLTAELQSLSLEIKFLASETLSTQLLLNVVVGEETKQWSLPVVYEAA